MQQLSLLLPWLFYCIWPTKPRYMHSLSLYWLIKEVRASLLSSSMSFMIRRQYSVPLASTLCLAYCKAVCWDANHEKRKASSGTLKNLYFAFKEYLYIGSLQIEKSSSEVKEASSESSLHEEFDSSESIELLCLCECTIMVRYPQKSFLYCYVGSLAIIWEKNLLIKFWMWLLKFLWTFLFPGASFLT